MGDAAVAIVAVVVLAGIVGFRRARGVLTPEARRTVARQDRRTRRRRAVGNVLSAARVAVGVAALAGIVWLTKQLFT